MNERFEIWVNGTLYETFGVCKVVSVSQARDRALTLAAEFLETHGEQAFSVRVIQKWEVAQVALDVRQ